MASFGSLLAVLTDGFVAIYNPLKSIEPLVTIPGNRTDYKDGAMLTMTELWLAVAVMNDARIDVYAAPNFTLTQRLIQPNLTRIPDQDAEVAMTNDHMACAGWDETHGFPLVPVYGWDTESGLWRVTTTISSPQTAGSCFGIGLLFLADGSLLAIGDYCLGMVYLYALTPDGLAHLVGQVAPSMWPEPASGFGASLAAVNNTLFISADQWGGHGAVYIAQVHPVAEWDSRPACEIVTLWQEGSAAFVNASFGQQLVAVIDTTGQPYVLARVAPHFSAYESGRIMIYTPTWVHSNLVKVLYEFGER